MVPWESVPVVAASPTVAASAVAAPAPPSVASPMAFVRLPVLVVVAEVLPLAAPLNLTPVGLSQPYLCPALALMMAPHRSD